jgi:hypothetical protein
VPVFDESDSHGVQHDFSLRRGRRGQLCSHGDLRKISADLGNIARRRPYPPTFKVTGHRPVLLAGRRRIYVGTPA